MYFCQLNIFRIVVVSRYIITELDLYSARITSLVYYNVHETKYLQFIYLFCTRQSLVF